MIQLFKPYIHPKAVEAANKTLISGWIGTGPKVVEFEEEFAAYTGAAHAIAVTSATAALSLAVKTLDLKPGDEVLTTSMTFISTNHVLLYHGLVPVFVDVDPDTLNIDLTKVQYAVTSKTKAIMAVHYGGNPIDIDGLYGVARHYNLKVIEDAAHACGASYKGRRIGSFGTTCFSFHAVKNLPVGDGGMITTNDSVLAHRLRGLRWLGIDASTFDRSKGSGYKWEYQVSEVGYKCAMNDITAAIGVEQLKRLDKWNRRRRQIVTKYADNLNGPTTPLMDAPNGESANHLFVTTVENRDEVITKMAKKGIELGVHYKPNHLYPMYTKYTRNSLRIAEFMYEHIISLPLHVGLTDDDVDSVIESLIEVV